MVEVAHTFGGAWTEKKLDILEKYLRAWLNIFHKNERARYFKKVYVDAFAGTGYRCDDSQCTEDLNIFGDAGMGAEEDAFLEGSVARVLSMDPGFDEYYFVDSKKQHAGSLQDFSNRPGAHVVQDDANHFIMDWVQREDWRKTRAVVFLDPYGMQVDWETLEALARTGGVDLWVLFPLGGGVNRMLTKGGLPPENWQQKLSKFFGTDQWKEEFYRSHEEDTLFGTEMMVEKTANFESMKQFFVKRLETIFVGVADNPSRLFNTRNNPLFLFCFATANEKAKTTALRISKQILSKI